MDESRIELIEWADITSLDSGGWLSQKELDRLDVATCKTVGWVYKETFPRSKTKGKIWVLSTLDGEGGGGHPHVIPKGCIVSREILTLSG